VPNLKFQLKVEEEIREGIIASNAKNESKKTTGSQ